jgi:hypothetical protein
LGELHTDLPRHAGERDLVRHLRASTDARLHIWCGLDFIPGVRDCDLLIAHEDVGFFLIEIKAVPLEEIESYGWKKCKIKGRSEDAGPVSQAAGAMHSLKDYLRGRDVKLPLTPTAAWPLISRQRWNVRWDDRRVCDEYAEKILFSEDVYSTPAALIERLRYLRSNPVHGDFRQGDPFSMKAQIETLTRELHVNAKPVQTPTDYERLRIIEDRVAKEERSRVPPRSARQPAAMRLRDPAMPGGSV